MNFEMFEYKEEVANELSKEGNSSIYPNRMQFFQGMKFNKENVRDIQEYERVIMEFRKLDSLIGKGVKAPNGVLLQYQKNPIRAFLIMDSKLTKETQQIMLDAFDLNFYVGRDDPRDDEDIESDSESRKCCSCCNCRIC